MENMLRKCSIQQIFFHVILLIYKEVKLETVQIKYNSIHFLLFFLK